MNNSERTDGTAMRQALGMTALLLVERRICVKNEHKEAF